WHSPWRPETHRLPPDQWAQVPSASYWLCENCWSHASIANDCASIANGCAVSAMIVFDTLYHRPPGKPPVRPLGSASRLARCPRWPVRSLPVIGPSRVVEASAQALQSLNRATSAVGGAGPVLSRHCRAAPPFGGTAALPLLLFIHALYDPAEALTWPPWCCWCAITRRRTG